MYKNIPTNIITGFLGVGKTTLIRQIIASLPEDSHWAVLVNEFGEIGIDGKMMADRDIQVEEVAGGCICCVSANAMGVGLNRLIRRYHPERILIEPSGLGHPEGIIKNLSQTPWSGVLDLRATICLVDARNLGDDRYLSHPIYQQQIRIADVLIAAKTDTYQQDDFDRFDDFSHNYALDKAVYVMAEQGDFNLSCLDTASMIAKSTHRNAVSLASSDVDNINVTCEMPPSDWHRVEAVREGYYSCSWKISANKLFDELCLSDVFSVFGLDRVKAIVHGKTNWNEVNISGSDQSLQPCQQQSYSYIEIIHHQLIDYDAMEKQLKHCVN